MQRVPCAGILYARTFITIFGVRLLAELFPEHLLDGPQQDPDNSRLLSLIPSPKPLSDYRPASTELGQLGRGQERCQLRQLRRSELAPGDTVILTENDSIDSRITKSLRNGSQ